MIPFPHDPAEGDSFQVAGVVYKFTGGSWTSGTGGTALTVEQLYLLFKLAESGGTASRPAAPATPEGFHYHDNETGRTYRRTTVSGVPSWEPVAHGSRQYAYKDGLEDDTDFLKEHEGCWFDLNGFNIDYVAGTHAAGFGTRYKANGPGTISHAGILRHTLSSTESYEMEFDGSEFRPVSIYDPFAGKTGDKRQKITGEETLSASRTFSFASDRGKHIRLDGRQLFGQSLTGDPLVSQKSSAGEMVTVSGPGFAQLWNFGPNYRLYDGDTLLVELQPSTYPKYTVIRGTDHRFPYNGRTVAFPIGEEIYAEDFFTTVRLNGYDLDLYNDTGADGDMVMVEGPGFVYTGLDNEYLYIPDNNPRTYRHNGTGWSPVNRYSPSETGAATTTALQDLRDDMNLPGSRTLSAHSVMILADLHTSVRLAGFTYTPDPSFGTEGARVAALGPGRVFLNGVSYYVPANHCFTLWYDNGEDLWLASSLGRAGQSGTLAAKPAASAVPENFTYWAHDTGQMFAAVLDAGVPVWIETTSPAVPDELTDLDTTVTGGQLDDIFARDWTETAANIPATDPLASFPSGKLSLTTITSTGQATGYPATGMLYTDRRPNHYLTSNLSYTYRYLRVNTSSTPEVWMQTCNNQPPHTLQAIPSLGPHSRPLEFLYHLQVLLWRLPLETVIQWVFPFAWTDAASLTVWMPAGATSMPRTATAATNRIASLFFIAFRGGRAVEALHQCRPTTRLDKTW